MTLVLPRIHPNRQAGRGTTDFLDDIMARSASTTVSELGSRVSFEPLKEVRRLHERACFRPKLLAEELVPQLASLTVAFLRLPSLLLPSRRQWEVPLWMTKLADVAEVVQSWKLPCWLPGVLPTSELFGKVRQ